MVEFDFNNTDDRLIFHVVGCVPSDSVFDITPTEKTKVFSNTISISGKHISFLSQDALCRNTAFILEKIRKEYIFDEVFKSDDDLKEVIYEIINEYTLWEDEEINSVIEPIVYIIKRVIIESYVVLDYESNEEEDYEKISYRTDKTSYLELDEVELYKVQNKVIYKYNIEETEYEKIGQLF